jgi:hypothetical protein
MTRLAPARHAAGHFNDHIFAVSVRFSIFFGD